MAFASDLQEEIADIFATRWKRREGLTVPDAERITLANDGVAIEGTVLYADLVDSSGLVDQFKDWFAAEVYKSFLVAACRIIRVHGGEITGFDGDRVMGVFVGNSKNSDAAKCALRINWAVSTIINPKLKAEYPDSAYMMRHAVGIDTSGLFVAKTGIRNNNDLVWVGRAANYAAKLSTIREEGYSTFITEDVFKKLNAPTKLGGSPKKLMWEKRTWAPQGISVYPSNWTWSM